jgi:hypothetical protein
MRPTQDKTASNTVPEAIVLAPCNSAAEWTDGKFQGETGPRIIAF